MRVLYEEYTAKSDGAAGARVASFDIIDSAVLCEVIDMWLAIPRRQLLLHKMSRILECFGSELHEISIDPLRRIVDETLI